MIVGILSAIGVCLPDRFSILSPSESNFCMVSVFSYTLLFDCLVVKPDVREESIDLSTSCLLWNRLLFAICDFSSNSLIPLFMTDAKLVFPATLRRIDPRERSNLESGCSVSSKLTAFSRCSTIGLSGPFTVPILLIITAISSRDVVT